MYTRVLLTLSSENNPGLRIKSSAWESIGFKIYRAHNFSEVLDYLALKESEILILDFDLIAHDPFACINILSVPIMVSWLQSQLILLIWITSWAAN